MATHHGVGRARIAPVITAAAGVSAVLLALGSEAVASSAHSPRRASARAQHHRGDNAEALPTATPIKHIVIVFQENRSFDRYFATYPYAVNPSGEPTFAPAPGTPTVNGLTPALLTHNDVWRQQQLVDHATHAHTRDSVSLRLVRLRRGS